MSDTDPQHLADEREREVDRLQQRSDELASEISDVRQDWQRKRADEGVPGAPPPDRDDAGEDGADSPGPQAQSEDGGPPAEEAKPEDRDEEPGEGAAESRGDQRGEG